MSGNSVTSDQLNDQIIRRACDMGPLTFSSGLCSKVCFGSDQEVPQPFPNVDRKTCSARCRSERPRHLRCEDFASEVTCSAT